MKKYQQLLIVSLGLVSFVCFLIYKHEYDRLRNVIEVLEVFGNPPSPVAPNPNDDIQLHNAAALAGAADLTNNNVNGVRHHDVNNVNPSNLHENVVQNPANSGEVIDNPENEENTGVGEVIKASYPLKSKKLAHNSVFENIEVLKGKN